MGIMDMLFGGDQAQTQSAPSINPTAINPIYGIPEGLLAEIKKEQQKAEMGQAIANLFGGAANIARGAQGGAPIYDPGSVAGASGGGGGSGGGLAIDGIVDRAMKFSQLRDMMDKRQQIAAQRAAIPQIAKQLGIPESMAAGLVDKLPDMFVRHQDAQFNANADVRKIEATLDAAGITDPVQRKAIFEKQFKTAPEQTNIKTGESEVTVFKTPDPTSPTGYKLVTADGKPYTGAEPTWKQETIKTPGGDFTVSVRKNPQSPSGFDVVDTITGKPVDINALQEQSIAAKAATKSAEATATNVAEKQAGLGRALNGIDEFTATVQDVLNDPSVNNYVGSAWGQLTSNIAGSDAADAAAKVNQLKAKAFLIGAQSLKGQGNLTETEGAKVEAAIGRLDPKQKPEQFRKALQEVAVSLQRLRQIALEEAGGQLQSRPQAQSAPSSEWQSLGNAGRIRRVN